MATGKRGKQSLPLSTAQMDNRWEELAREDAEFYIWTDLAAGDDFFRSGKRDADRILAMAVPHLRGTTLAIEIGCGVGRITLPMAATFGSIVAVDVAPTMLEKLVRNCKEQGIQNVSPALADSTWDTPASADFAYSRIVFQHIERWETIDDYFKRIAQSLVPNGVLYVQFDTRPANPLYHLKNRLPDMLLPRTLRRGVRRIRRNASDIVDLASAWGLELLCEAGRGTLDNEFVFRAVARQ